MHDRVLALYILLANDKNPLVFQSAYSSLGKFIYYFSVWNEFLIDQAVLLSKSTFSQSAELAYYLPGICRKFLPYKEKIIEILIFLLENPQSFVRAKAVGCLEFFIRNLKSNFCNKIVPIYTNLLRDLDTVKIKAIKTLPFLLQNIENSSHSLFFGTFRRIQTNTNN